MEPRKRLAFLGRWIRPGLVAALCWLYLLSAIGLWIFLRVAGERWWIGTLVLFGHRWVWLLPLLVLLPAATFRHRRSLLPLAIAAVVVLGPLMDLCLPWRQWLSRSPQGPALRILTCNTHGSATDPAAMGALVAANSPDVVLFQEWHSKREIIFPGPGWHFLQDGELFIASRHPVSRVKGAVLHRNTHGAAAQYQIHTPAGAFRIYNVHLASPHQAFRSAINGADDASEKVEENSQRRYEGARMLVQSADQQAEPVLIGGDFNLPCDSTIYRQTLSGYADAFTVAGFGYGWTYRVRGTVTRIDHIVSRGGLRCRSCWVGPDVGSPHRPLLAEFYWEKR